MCKVVLNISLGFSYRSAGVELREKREKYVIPGLTREAAAEITRQRKAAEAASQQPQSKPQQQTKKKNAPKPKQQSTKKDAPVGRLVFISMQA